MDQRAAFAETVRIAREREYGLIEFDQVGVDYDHFLSMQERMVDDFSEAKLGRWLGYIQGVLVANGCITLEEAKAINQKFADQAS
jgi:hypothetical protein